jgi:apolipoprotein N-acyltransferase
MRTLAAALLLGAATVLAFSPFDLYPLPLLTLGLLFRYWHAAASPRQAALLGLAWGAGLFGAGVSWVYVSLHDVGGMVAPLAVAATAAFCLYLALFPALAGWCYARLRGDGAWLDALLAGALWTLTEWLRGWLFTGFPWLAIGYAQTPPSPLAGLVPVLGCDGVGFLVAVLAAALAMHFRRPAAWMVLILAILAGLAGRQTSWTEPVGAPVTVSLLQGNIPQSLKWVPERLPQSIATYRRLAASHPAELTVLPETAMPMLFGAIPDEVLTDLKQHGDVVIGAAISTADGGYGNGAIAVPVQGVPQVYTKVHLVPFGEFVPAGFAWFFGLVNIPMSGFSAGSPGQAPLMVAGQRLAVTICYEDLFAAELRPAVPGATLIVNLSNTAWFGDSLAQPQHLQIARMRALEAGRPVLRATNTGMTAAIAGNGDVIDVLPPFVEGGLTVSVRGHQGLTPYGTAGGAPILLLATLAVLMAFGQRRRMLPR